MPPFLERLLLGAAGVVRGVFLHPVDLGVAAVVEQKGRVVLVRHSYKSGWLLPGGGVDRHEPPEMAIQRELQEEIGLAHAAPPELLGTYIRRTLVTNLILLYRLRDAEFDFRPSLEIRELHLADPEDLPLGTAPAVFRRLRELRSEIPVSPYW